MTIINQFPIAEEEKEEDSKEGSDLQSKLLKTRTIIISSAVDSKLAQKIIQQVLLLEADDAEAEIKLIINSPGGEVYSGMAIFDMLKFVSCPVATLVAGFAASMGSLLSLVGDKDRVFALPHSKIMIHQPLIQGARGVVTDLEITADEIVKTRKNIAQMYADKTGKKVDQIMKDMDRDHWFTAEEALEYGLIDKIITNRSEFK